MIFETLRNLQTLRMEGPALKQNMGTQQIRTHVLYQLAFLT